MLDLPDPETLKALAAVLASVAAIIGALGTLVWNARRKD